jgi:lysozyme
MSTEYTAAVISLIARVFTRPHPTIPDKVVVRPTVKVGGAVATAAAATWLVIATPFVAGFEGYARKPYVDTVGSGRPITWCYGETKADGGPVPPLNKVFTKAECTASLQDKLTRVYYPYVQKCAPGQPPHRTAALVSFVYNLGPGALCNGPVGRYLRAGNVTAGCNAMLAYDHAAGRRLAGLTRRRQEERALCLRSD